MIASHWRHRSILEELVRWCSDTNLNDGKVPLTTYAIRRGEVLRVVEVLRYSR